MVKIAFLIMALMSLFSEISDAQDDRYRTYGKLEWENISETKGGCTNTEITTPINYRTNKGGDFITVGKLDGANSVIYPDDQEKFGLAFGLLLDYNSALDGQYCMNTGDCGWIGQKIEELTGINVGQNYRNILVNLYDGIRWFNGDEIVVPQDITNFKLRTKESVLNEFRIKEVDYVQSQYSGNSTYSQKAFHAALNWVYEGPNGDERFLCHVLESSGSTEGFSEDCILRDKCQITGNTAHCEVVFEIANEPNMFPYVPPELYAQYYADFSVVLQITEQVLSATPPLAKDQAEYFMDVQGIDDNVNEYNIQFDFKIMPGGLWINEGLPDAIADPDNPIFNEEHLLNKDLWWMIGGMYYFPQNATGGIEPPEKNTLDYFARFINKLESISNYPASDYIDKIDLHYYPYVWKYFDSHHPVLSDEDLWEANPIAGNTEEKLVNMFENFNNTALNLELLINVMGQYSNDQEVWITETGNINPFSEELAAYFMSKVFDRLEDISNRGASGESGSISPGLTRWYYYKVNGEDHKMEWLDLAGDPFEQILELFPGVSEEDRQQILNATSTSSCKDPLNDMGEYQYVIACLLLDYANQKPTQGLHDGEEEPKLRTLGAEFIKRATGTSCRETFLDDFEQSPITFDDFINKNAILVGSVYTPLLLN